jgi:ribosomal protein S18 acetylase RimI-like enzyme
MKQATKSFDMIEYRLKPEVTSSELNALFSRGSPGHGWPRWQQAPDTSDWTSVLAHSLAWVCAYLDDELVGFVNVAWDGRDHAFLLDTRVDPDLRDRGIGTELVRLAAVSARNAGCTCLHVDYEEQLAPFYEACGFKPTAAALVFLD